MRICDEYEGSVKDSGYPTIPENRSDGIAHRQTSQPLSLRLSLTDCVSLTSLENTLSRDTLSLGSEAGSAQSQTISQLEHHVGLILTLLPLLDQLPLGLSSEQELLVIRVESSAGRGEVDATCELSGTGLSLGRRGARGVGDERGGDGRLRGDGVVSRFGRGYRLGRERHD